MDAGLAAVLGALAGSVGTVLAGATTGWFSREQARISARAEHVRQRRDPREEAYRELIEVISKLHSDIGNRLIVGPPQAFLHFRDDEAFFDQVRQAKVTIYEQWPRVALAGPENVVVLAKAAMERSQTLITHVLMYRTLQTMPGRSEEDPRSYLNLVRASAGALNDALEAFVRAARETLDVDGTI